MDMKMRVAKAAASEQGVGWKVRERVRTTSESISESPKAGIDGSTPRQHLAHELLQEGAFTEHKYSKFHDRALAERAANGVGKSAEMNVLFRFWNYFLREHYSKKMMDEFRSLALDDCANGSRYL
jgi:la-related protein 1